MKRKLKLGLLGNGIAKTQSKKLHELMGKLYDIDVQYNLIDLSHKENVNIREELSKCQKEAFDGVNVTHPYKKDAFLDMTLMQNFPRGLSSVNTVLFKGDGLVADNTDYLGFIQAYKDKFADDKPGKVLILGTGGVGVAIAFGLYKLEAEELIIDDMNYTLVEELLEVLQKLGVNARRVNKTLADEMKNCDGLVNATPLGMYQCPGCAFERDGFSKQRWAFDAVYTPVETKFLKMCEECHISTISGFKLFLYQGVEGFKRFSGLDIDGSFVEREFLKEYPLKD